MKIIRFSASNFKRLVAVEIKPDSDVITISGKNGAGKSSVIDGICAALGGKRAAPAKPIRDGEEKAELVVETEDLVVMRKFTLKGEYLEVTNRDGFQAKSPQTVLDKLVGMVAFDPLAFIAKKDKERRQILIDLMGVDLTAHDKRIAALQERRRGLLAEKKRAAEQWEQMPMWPDAPMEEMSMSNLLGRLNAANAANKEHDRLRAKAAEKLNALTELHGELERLKSRIAEAEAAAQQSQAELAKSERIDTAEIEKEAAEIEETNRKARDNQAYAQAQQALDVLAQEIHAEYQEIQQAETDKANALAQVKLPIEGLSVDDTGVLFNNIPLSQVNHARQLEISMAIQMALNPKLEVVFIDGNGLDGDTRARIITMAREKGYQVWEERTDETGKLGVVIEDGLVKQN